MWRIMRKVIHKYALEIEGTQKIRMPAKAQLLTVKPQRGKLQLWALVDITAAVVEREIWIATTGGPFEVPDGMQYVATFFLYDGEFVGHVFG